MWPTTLFGVSQARLSPSFLILSSLISASTSMAGIRTRMASAPPEARSSDVGAEYVATSAIEAAIAASRGSGAAGSAGRATPPDDGLVS